jgi:hypothetical protein
MSIFKEKGKYVQNEKKWKEWKTEKKGICKQKAAERERKNGEKD